MSSAARAEAAASPWPPVGGLVRVIAGEAHAWLGSAGRASRVEDVTDAGIAIAAPRGPGDVEPPREGDEFELRWPAARGLQVLPVRLVERGRDGVSLWWCEPVGGVLLQQRRAFVRAQASGSAPVRVVLRWSGPDAGGDEHGAGGRAEGTLVDLSEGGLRVRLRGWPGGQDVPVLITLVVPEDAAPGPDGPGGGGPDVEHELRGTALRGREPDGVVTAVGVVDVSVQFEQPVPRADQLRALVFAWQRAERRAGRA